MKSLCERGQCPYFNPAHNDPSGHGCTRFSTAAQCPAVNEFALDPAKLKDYMERWLAADKKYRSDLEFQKEFPGELPFPNRAIDHPCINPDDN